MSQAEYTGVQGVSGIGGWLILPTLGLVLTPFLGLTTIMQSLPVLQGLGQLPVAQGTFIVFELVINVLFQAVAPVFLLIQLFQKRSTFPKFYQIFLALNLGFIVLDLCLAYALFKDVFDSGAAQMWDRDTMRAVAQGVIGCAIWIPYMSRSVRVRNTFTQ